MDKKTGKVETPDEGQPLGKDYPFEEDVVEPEEPGRLVDSSNAYENMAGTDEAPEDKGAAPSGPFDVPDDDLSGEGWSPPMQPGTGWVHPREKALEEDLEQTEGLDEEGLP